MSNDDSSVFKQYFQILGFSLIEEIIREKDGIIQFKIERNRLFCVISYIENKPLCEFIFPFPFVDENEITKVTELIKDHKFLFEYKN